MNDTTQGGESRELVVAKKIAGHLNQMMPEYKAVLPDHISPQAFIRVAQTAIQLNEGLQQCSPRSLIAACTRLAEMGLQPDGVEAALVAFEVNVKRTNPETGLTEWRKERRATPMPMVAGIRDLVRRSGQVKDWKVRIVRKGDKFRHVDGDVESLIHEPEYDDDAPITHVYSIAYLESGELNRHVMTIAAVEKIRRRSRSPDKGPWVDHYDEMVKKTCLKQHSKALPKAKDDLNRIRFMGMMRALDDGEGETRDLPLVDLPQLSAEQAARDRLYAAVDAQVFEDDVAPPASAPIGAAEVVNAGQQTVQAGPKAPRKPRRTAAERLAEANAPRQPKQPPAASPAPQARDIQAEVDDVTQSGRDLEYERQMTSIPPAPDNDRFPGDPDPNERSGEDPEELSYRDGWHARSKGQPRVPPRTLNTASDVHAWLEGWDSFQKAVDIGNAPKTQAASDAMLDQMVGKVFA